jgi:hypothetical protein
VADQVSVATRLVEEHTGSGVELATGEVVHDRGHRIHDDAAGAHPWRGIAHQARDDP